MANWTAGAKFATGTMENPEARAAKPWKRPEITRVPTGMESVTLSPMSKVRGIVLRTDSSFDDRICTQN